jgi:hypothetical protein
VVRRRTLAPPAGARVYELTARGMGLEPVVAALGRWGSLAPFPPGDSPIGIDSTVIALRTLFAPSAADGLEASIQLRLDGQPFRARVGEGRLVIARGEAGRPDATIETDPGTLSALLWQGRSLAQAQRSGDVRVEGSRATLKRFLGLFPLPAAATG